MSSSFLFFYPSYELFLFSNNEVTMSQAPSYHSYLVSIYSFLCYIFSYTSQPISPKTIPHLPLHTSYTLLLQPHQVSVLSENPFAKLLPHLSPSFPGPSFSDFPPGPPVPARPPSIHPANFRLRIFHKMFRNVPSLNVSTKVSNVPHTSFFVSLLMLSTGFTSMHSPRYDITVTHKD